MNYKLDIESDVLKILRKLPAKQFKQLINAILGLLERPKPHDSSALKGYQDLLAIGCR